jgi:hypothetical protein
MTNQNVDINKILSESEDGAQSPFMEKARGQMMLVRIAKAIQFDDRDLEARCSSSECKSSRH